MQHYRIMNGALDRVIYARVQYLRALDVAEQWQRTAAVTGLAHHQRLAEICRAIAQERFAALQRLDAEARVAVAAAREARRASMDRHCDLMAASLAEARHAIQAADEVLGRPGPTGEPDRGVRTLVSDHAGFTGAAMVP
jgi:hypothetical protein